MTLELITFILFVLLCLCFHAEANNSLRPKSINPKFKVKEYGNNYYVIMFKDSFYLTWQPLATKSNGVIKFKSLDEVNEWIDSYLKNKHKEQLDKKCTATFNVTYKIKR